MKVQKKSELLAYIKKKLYLCTEIVTHITVMFVTIIQKL